MKYLQFARESQEIKKDQMTHSSPKDHHYFRFSRVLAIVNANDNTQLRRGSCLSLTLHRLASGFAAVRGCDIFGCRIAELRVCFFALFCVDESLNSLSLASWQYLVPTLLADNTQ
jgi:hypothetical protein